MTRLTFSSSPDPPTPSSSTSSRSATLSTGSVPRVFSTLDSETPFLFRCTPPAHGQDPFSRSPGPSVSSRRGGSRSPTTSTTLSHTVSLRPPHSSAPSSSSSSSSAPSSTSSTSSSSSSLTLTPSSSSTPTLSSSSAPTPSFSTPTPSFSTPTPSFSTPTPSNSQSPRSPRRSRRISRTVQPPHDVKDEELPSSQFNDPGFQAAFADAKTLVSGLADRLGSSPLHINPDSTIRKLHKKAQTLARFECPSTRTVGFVGDSGVGKSSLLNSLLDRQGLARTSNSGAACTCVVTEYHFHDRNDFTIDVELFSRESLRQQVSDLLQSYRHYHLDLQAGENADDSEARDFEEQAQVALDTFRAMFRGVLDEDFLAEETTDIVLEILQSWLTGTRPDHVSGQQSQATLEECAGLLMTLTSDTASSNQPAVWPYIKKIKVFLNSHILSKGLVLVDLPGLRDLNSARRSITERYLIECNEILAVCNIGRATTDVGVASVFELAKKAGLKNIGIVCTKSDDIRAEEAIKDWKGQRARRIQQLNNAAAASQRELDDIDLSLAEFDDDVVMSDEDKDEYMELSRQRRTALRDRELNLFRLKQYLIETRNASIITHLIDHYGGQIAPGEPNVFCVSNTEYWAKRSEPRDLGLPTLQLSGILTLRKHCLSIVADTQLKTAITFVRSDIPALLDDVALWIESGAGSVNAEWKRTIRKTLNTVERRLQKDLAGRDSELSRVSKAFKEGFKTQIFNIRQTGHWTELASEEGYEWNGWHHATYSAFCRNYGNYSTPKVGYHDWNERIIHGMVYDLAPPWQRLCLFMQEKLEDATLLIEHVMNRSMDFIETKLEGRSRSTEDILIRALVSRQNLMISRMEQLGDEFDTELSTLRVDALTSIRTSLIGTAMESSYRACNQEYGSGSDRRRKDIINDALQDHDLFRNLVREFLRRFFALTDELQENINTAMSTSIDDVSATFDLVRNENVATESEENPELRGLLESELLSIRGPLQHIQETMGA